MNSQNIAPENAYATMKYRTPLIALLAFTLATRSSAGASDRVVYEGKQGPGKGKHIVFLTGDEEYRSEEGLTRSKAPTCW